MIDTSGQEVAKRSYLPFGETWGVSSTELPTDYTFTGQREAAEIGLKYYVARWYDSEIGHFVQADSLVPDAGNPTAWNRYAYVSNNPLSYIDPSGHSGIINPSVNSTLSDSRGGIIVIFAVDLDDVVNRYQLSPENSDAYGYSSCGLYAISIAGVLVSELYNKRSEFGYDINDGIQPSNLEKLANHFYEDENVNVYQADSGASINMIIDALADGLVVVDFLVEKNSEGKYVVTGRGGGNSVAHFAWVIGVDLISNTIYLEDTLNSDQAYWAVNINVFLLA